MNLGMAAGAVTVEREPQIMKARGCGAERSTSIVECGCIGVAFQAEPAHFWPIQEPGVGRAMILMAGTATFHTNGGVLEGEGATLVGVALEAARFIVGCSGRCVQAKRTGSAMWIVAIDARHRALGNGMTMRPLEGGPGAGMTTGANLIDSRGAGCRKSQPGEGCGRLRRQVAKQGQGVICNGMVDRMAAHAGNLNL